MKLKYQLLFSISVLLGLIAGCENKQVYYYSEDGKNKMEIEATSDSAAYMKAFFNFHASKKIYRDEKVVNPGLKRKEPTYFSLLDYKHRDITNKVQFAKKDSLEKRVINKMLNIDNIFLDEIEKTRKIEQ
ncbi:MAG: hypothetical protein ACOVP7_04280 [Lacibacter sp.]